MGVMADICCHTPTSENKPWGKSTEWKIKFDRKYAVEYIFFTKQENRPDFNDNEDRSYNIKVEMFDTGKVKFTRYTLLDVDQEDGCVTLMDVNGEIKEDANLVKSEDGPERFDAVGQEVARRFEEGEELEVVVFACMGREVVTEVHTAVDTA